MSDRRRTLVPKMALQNDKQQLKKHPSSEDSESIPTLLPEIIVEILLKLPVESLLICIYVCKLWYSLISNPHFIKSHFTLSSRSNKYTNHRLIFTTFSRLNLNICPLYDVFFDNSITNVLELGYPLKQFALKPPLSIAGSCNGLLCIAVEDNTPFICNPSTKRSNRVPYCGFKMRSGWYVMYGFGYDEGSDDYKVVGISRCYQNRAKNENKAKVYSLKSGNWKDINDFPAGYPLTEYGKFSNGALHWMATQNYGSYNQVTIVLLDLSNESFGEVLQPAYDEGDKDLTLGVLGDWLCVLCNYGGNRADVWVMKVYGVKDSWTKLVSIPYLTDPGRERFSVPLFISNDEKILLQLGSELVLYDSKNSSFSEIRGLDICSYVSTFVESLVSPGFW